MWKSENRAFTYLSYFPSNELAIKVLLSKVRDKKTEAGVVLLLVYKTLSHSKPDFNVFLL